MGVGYARCVPGAGALRIGAIALLSAVAGCGRADGEVAECTCVVSVDIGDGSRVAVADEQRQVCVTDGDVGSEEAAADCLAAYESGDDANSGHACACDCVLTVDRCVAG